MNKVASVLKPLMPILSAIYGIAIIYVTALPVAGDHSGFVGDMQMTNNLPRCHQRGHFLHVRC